MLRARPRLALLAGAALLSAFGSGVLSVVFTYAAYSISGTVLASIAVAFAYCLPSVVLLHVTGPMLQRVDAKLITVVELSASIAIYVGMGVLASRGPLTLGFLIVASAIEGVLTAVALPAWSRLRREAAPPGGLDALNALLASAGSLGSLAGVVCGGWVYDLAGPAWSFIIDGLTFAPLAIAAALLPRTKTGPPSTSPSLRGAVPAFRDIPLLRAVVTVELVLVVLCWPVLQLVPQLTGEVSMTARAFSAVMGSYYLGAVGVSWSVRHLASRMTHRAFLTSGLLALGAVLIGVGLAGRLTSQAWHLTGLCALMAAFGLALGSLGVLLTSGLQQGAPIESSSAIFAMYSSTVKILQMVVALVLGVLALWAPVGWVILVMGLAVVLLHRVVAHHPVTRALDDLDPEGLTPREGRARFGLHVIPGLGRRAAHEPRGR